MKRRTLSLALAAALALSLLGGAVLAAESGAETPEVPQPSAEEYIPDPVGSITFASLERRMREGNLNVLTLEENIQALKSIDYEEMKEDVRKGLNEIAGAQWQLITSGSSVQIPGAESNPALSGISQALSGIVQMNASSTQQQLQLQYDAMRETFDDLKNGKIQEDNADIVRQLENAQNQVIMAGETLYIALLDMERTDRGLERQLTALDRTLEELELRCQLGHISAQTLKQTQAGRASLVSGKQTLESNIQTYKMQLELLVGAELTGKISLGALPQVSGGELDAMDLEKDLAAAKEASYSLYEAGKTLEDAEKEFKDKGKEYNHSEKNYEYVMAKHQWQAAQYNYNATVQNYEMSFRALYLQVKDYSQVLDAARTALTVEQDNCAVAQLKHSRGDISQNALLDARDKASQAQETVDSAASDLFTAYHNYRWAVDYGILN